MSFLFINKTLPLNTLKIRTAMNAKISPFLVLKRSYNLHDCPLKSGECFSDFLSFIQDMEHICSKYGIMNYSVYSLWQRVRICFWNVHRKCYIKKGFLKNFVNFTGKHPCWKLLSMKLQAWRLATLLKETPTQVFPEKFVKFLRTLILKNVCERLL